MVSALAKKHKETKGRVPRRHNVLLYRKGHANSHTYTIGKHSERNFWRIQNESKYGMTNELKTGKFKCDLVEVEKCKTAASKCDDREAPEMADETYPESEPEEVVPEVVEEIVNGGQTLKIDHGGVEGPDEAGKLKSTSQYEAYQPDLMQRSLSSLDNGERLRVSTRRLWPRQVRNSYGELQSPKCNLHAINARKEHLAREEAMDAGGDPAFIDTFESTKQGLTSPKLKRPQRNASAML